MLVKPAPMNGEEIPLLPKIIPPLSEPEEELLRPLQI